MISQKGLETHSESRSAHSRHIRASRGTQLVLFSSLASFIILLHVIIHILIQAEKETSRSHFRWNKPFKQLQAEIG